MDKQLGRTLPVVLLLCHLVSCDWQTVCPYKCQCFTPLRVLCADERMSSLPRNMSRHVRELIIMTSSVAYLFPHSLVDSPQLTKLIFLNNALRSVHLNAFEHLTELQELELSGNPTLDHFYLGTFSKQEKLTKLLLNYNNIKAIIPGMFDSLKQLEVLEMKSNVLSELPPFLFQNLRSLKVLGLSQNKIQEVKVGTFSGLANLEILKLNSNLICNLTSDLFHHIPQLTELHLERNRIAHLDDGLFSVLTNLSVLNLRGNLLTSFNEKVFGSELTNLRELNLKSNKLTELSLRNLSSLVDLTLSDNRLSSLTENVFRNLSALENLDLSDNQLTSLPERIFKDLLSIQVINLHNNNLTNVDSQLFENQVFIERLYLSHNQLEGLPVGVLDYFAPEQKVRLHGNPWRCDCQLWYFHEWLLQNRQNIEFLDIVACDSPDHLKRRTVVSIHRDQLVCPLTEDQSTNLNSCSLQVSNDTIVIMCKVEKCSPTTVKVQFKKENGEIREHILQNRSENVQCNKNETLRQNTLD